MLESSLYFKDVYNINDAIIISLIFILEISFFVMFFKYALPLHPIKIKIKRPRLFGNLFFILNIFIGMFFITLTFNRLTYNHIIFDFTVNTEILSVFLSFFIVQADFLLKEKK